MTEAERLIRSARLFVFDFDGTLVDSNAIKFRGFDLTFEQYPEKLAEISAYCRQRNDVVRGEKFRHVYEQILGLDYTPERAAAAEGRYAAVTTQAVIDAREIAGAMAFLAVLEARAPIALLSNTPQDVLLRILSARHWTRFFAHVQGAPVRKSAWLTRAARARRLSPDTVVFFGDAVEDLTAAAEAECSFIGVANRELASATPAWIADYMEIAAAFAMSDASVPFKAVS
jgi:beta-phosphoglucomutase-like phosphatase (HAD superfamily)